MNSPTILTRGPGLPKFQDVPEVRLRYTSGALVTELDDDTAVHALEFRPVQAVRITTWDASVDPGLLPRDGIFENTSSAWIRDLRRSLSTNDPDADFLERARHFVIACYDEIVEVIAWDVSYSVTRSTEVNNWPNN